MWSSRLLVTGQITGILLALAALAFSPPSIGKMMLVPLSDVAARRVTLLAVSAGATLIDPARYPARSSSRASGTGYRTHWLPRPC
jgi:hypothetical protein